MCTTLHYTILRCTILHCTVLHFTTLQVSVLVLENLNPKYKADMRLVDLKLGIFTAEGNWMGKKRLNANKNNLLDALTSSDQVATRSFLYRDVYRIFPVSRRVPAFATFRILLRSPFC